MSIQCHVLYRNIPGIMKGQSYSVGCNRLIFFWAFIRKGFKRGCFKLQHSHFTSYFILIANMELEAITS